MSGLMVSLAVVVLAILAVVFLVFTDQPATERLRTLRGQTGGRPSAPPPASEAVANGGSGPPPAHVLQRQLALPSFHKAATTSKRARQAAPTTFAPRPPPPAPSAPRVAAEAPAFRALERDGVTFWTRMRSSVALLALLTVVGTIVALAIGATMFMASLALRHALR